MLRYLLSLGTLNRFTMNNKPKPQEVVPEEGLPHPPTVPLNPPKP